jgi:hypothetical protein
MRVAILTPMPDLDKSNELLQEIRDLLAAQEGRHDKALAANKALYDEYQRRNSRRQIIAAIVVGVGVALLLFATE